MLPPDELARAIDIQQRSYRLLRWVGDAIDAGRLAPATATRHAEGPEAAVDWVRRFHHTFPHDVAVEDADVEALGNVFWTYVVASFDVRVEPSERGAFGTGGCTCDLCVRLVDAGHLRTKKLRAHDKRRALDLMVARATALAAEHGLTVDGEAVRSLLDDAELRRAMAFSAYGESLLERVRGTVDGPSVLVLWREIAWTRQGSPRKGFRLDADDVAAAEALVLEALAAPTEPSSL